VKEACGEDNSQINLPPFHSEAQSSRHDLH